MHDKKLKLKYKLNKVKFKVHKNHRTVVNYKLLSFLLKIAKRTRKVAKNIRRLRKKHFRR